MRHTKLAAFASSIAFAACAALFPIAANSAEPTTWEKVKAYSHEKKKEAVVQGKKALAEADKKLAELEKAARKSKGEAKAAHEANMKELRAKKKAAAEKLASMEKSSGEAWDATKTGFADAYQDLHEAYEKAHAAVTSKR